MLTILIRTSYRPKGFNNLLQSINSEAGILVSYDDERALNYIPSGIKTIKVERNGEDFGYNKYINALKSEVKTGWFIVVDDDDTIIPGSLQKLKPILTATNPCAVLVQFMRGTFLKPHPAIFGEQQIKIGHIGFPSLILHSSFASICDVGSGEYADYYYIKAISERVKIKWLNGLPVVSSPVRSMGRME